MAGAGRKTFIAGEVLTAAQVNDYLMDQAVMRFSGSAARAASITVPTEGMVTYLDDSNSVEYYDGSNWIRLEVASDDIRNLISASGQLVAGVGSGSLGTVAAGPDGYVLTADSTASTGMSWKVVEAGGAAVYFQVAASGVTALPSPLTAGFYRIATSTTTTWTDQQFRFVDTAGNFYGATITGGTGFMTIPVTVASVNLTTASAAPFTVLAEEIVGVTSTLLDPPSVTSFGWTTLGGGSLVATTASNAASIGAFDITTGRFYNMGVASVRTGASIVSDFQTLSSSYQVTIVQANPTGVWSTASPITSPAYPFQIFTANGTYVPPPWSTSADVVIVSGGGGGRPGKGFPNQAAGAGGGAGGASLFTNVATPGSVAVTIGAGGAVSTQGSSSSFGALTLAGGGAGGAWPNGAGGTGGSGGGGGTPAGTGGAAGPGGSAGSPANGAYAGGAGGGHAAAGSGRLGGAGANFLGRMLAGGGGGGMSDSLPSANAGGVGGGGQGGSRTFSSPSPFPNRYGSPGTANTGGGGGGGGINYTGPAGTGGSGIVIVRAK